MAKFLFWNVCKKDLTEQIVGLCREHEVDVLILAESEIEDWRLEERLNEDQERKYAYLYPQFEKISFFHRYQEGEFEPLFAEPQMTGISVPNVVLKPPVGGDVLIVAIHAPSKLHRERETQEYYTREIMNEIRFYEAERSNIRTVVVGDMNMNPFENGLTAFDCFHSVMDKRIALKNQRDVYGSTNLFFYNPMWRVMGNGPSGTYFYSSSEVVEYFWHTFDQVLIRPALIEYFRDESLKIVDSIGGVSLLDNKGRPDKNKHSDHLPLLFEVNIENIEEATDHGKEKSLGDSRCYS